MMPDDGVVQVGQGGQKTSIFKAFSDDEKR